MSRHKQEWTKEEEDTLRKWQTEHVPTKEMATRFGRSVGSIKGRIRILGIARKSGGRPYTPEEVKKIRDWCKARVPIKVQAKRLGRHKDAIRTKINKLGCGRKVVQRTWTEAESVYLKEELAKHVPITRIAVALGRSPTSLRRRIGREKLSTKVWGRAWTDGEVNKVRDWQEEGVPGLEQARRLNRSYASWAAGVVRFNLQGHPHTNYNHEIRAEIMLWIPFGLNQAQIAAKLGKSRTTIGPIFREMEEKGLIRRKARCGPYEVTKAWAGGGD